MVAVSIVQKKEKIWTREQFKTDQEGNHKMERSSEKRSQRWEERREGPSKMGVRLVLGIFGLSLILMLGGPGLLAHKPGSEPPASPLASLDVGTVRRLLQRLGGADFETRQVEIRKISPGIGGEAIVEARIETAYRFRKQDDDWEVAEIRLGDRQWESLELIREGVRREKVRRTRLQLRELTTSLSSYLTANGSYVEAQTLQGLLDGLTPAHLRVPQWFDQWGTPLLYRGGKQEFRLRSAGPDRQFDTSDDLVADSSAQAPPSR